MNNQQYIKDLTDISKNKIITDFDNKEIFNELKFTEFEFINSFLVNQAIEKPFNLLIKLPEKKAKIDFYYPTILICALKSFYKNYVYYQPNYKIGDILQKNGVRYEIKKIVGDTYILFDARPNHQDAQINVTKEGIKIYIKTKENLSERRVKRKFDSYKDFFSNVFKIGNKIPSDFNYKTLIISDKKSIQTFLSTKKHNDSDYSQLLPIEYIWNDKIYVITEDSIQNTRNNFLFHKEIISLKNKTFNTEKELIEALRKITENKINDKYLQNIISKCKDKELVKNPDVNSNFGFKLVDKTVYKITESACNLIDNYISVLSNLKSKNFDNINEIQNSRNKEIPDYIVTFLKTQTKCKSGKYNSSSELPIDPMIYVVKDYKTAKEHLINNINIKIDNLLIIGTTKYENDLLEISEDLRNRKFNSCIVIGDKEIQNNELPNLLKWNWTLPELNHFKQADIIELQIIRTESVDLNEKIEQFFSYLSTIEKDYTINLSGILKYLKYLNNIIVPDSASRFCKEIQRIKDLFKNEASNLIDTTFTEIGIYDYDEYTEEIIAKFNSIADLLNHNFLKFNLLKQFQNNEFYLVVTKQSLDLWKSELKRLKFLKCQVITYSDYLEKIEEQSINHFLFLSIFNYAHYKGIINCKHKNTLILYDNEIELLNKFKAKYALEVYNELKSDDRFKISGLKFIEIPNPEQADDLIERLFNQDLFFKSYENSIYDSDSIFFRINFTNSNEFVELSGSKTVVLIDNSKTERKEKVCNLQTGDKIRIYENNTKEKLYEIILANDKQGRFLEIEKMSKLWKQTLIDFQNIHRFSNEKLFETLKNQKSPISINRIATLNNWLNLKSNVKFPQKNKDLFSIKSLVNNELLNRSYDNLIKTRNFYSGIMIGLGRDLSDELIDFVINGKKGNNITKFTDIEINQLIERNAPIKVIKDISIIQNTNAAE